MEVEDILTNVRQGPPFQTCMLQEKAIEPVGESKSDYEIVLADRRQAGHDGARSPRARRSRTCRRRSSRACTVDRVHDLGRVRGEEVLRLPDRGRLGAGPARVCASSTRIPKNHPLKTPSGLLEFYSERLATHFPTTRSGRRSRSGSSAASPTTSASRASAPTCSRSCSCPTTRAGARTPRATTARGRARRRPARCSGPDNYRYEPVWLQPEGRGRARHPARRYRQDLQRARHRARRRLRVGAHDAGRRPTSTTAPGTTPSSRARWTAAAPSTPSPRTASPPRTPAARPRAATSWTCRRSGPRSGRPGEGTTPRPSRESTTPVPACASTAGWSREVTTDHEGIHRRRRRLQRLLRLPVRLQGRARGQRLGADRQAPA